MVFTDRADAGRQLARALDRLKIQRPVVVLGIPRGGVIVAAEVARYFGAPLDICPVHKIGAPGNPELAIGSVAADGESFYDAAMMRACAVPESYLGAEMAAQQRELRRRLALYRSGRAEADLQSSTAILVDDGIATGSTIRVALKFLTGRGAARIILAAPVGAVEPCERLSRLVDELVVIHRAADFRAVGEFYRRFDQTTDEEVIAAMKENNLP